MEEIKATGPLPMTLDQALDHLRHGVRVAPSPEFPDAVNARLVRAPQTAARQCAKVPAATIQRVLKLLDVAVKAPTQVQRLNPRVSE